MNTAVRAPQVQNWQKTAAAGYPFVLFIFLLLAVFTRSRVLNDTFYYVADVSTSLHCPSIHECPELWDAGHLLWRPTGRLLFLFFGGALESGLKLSESAAIVLLLKTWSGLAILTAACLLYSILARGTERIFISLLVAAAFLCACEMLYALHSGTSYPSGLACLTAGIWCTSLERRIGDARCAGLAGTFGALAGAFWLPYIVVLPALLCWVVLNTKGRPVKTAFVLISSTAVVGCALFGLGAHWAGISSARGFVEWVIHSGHDTKQTHNLVRAIFGLPRSFLDLGQFGVRMKQFLLHDPYADVKVTQLIQQAVWKIVLFYLALGCSILLFLEKSGRRVLIALGIAFLGNLGLAIAFEAGSQERYLPLYPFLFIALAFCLSQKEMPRIAKFTVLLLVAVMVLGNLPNSSVWNVRGEHRQLFSRVSALGALPARSVLFLVGDDPLLHIVQITPLDELDRLPTTQIESIYVPLMNAASWKHDFAAKALSTWEQGGNVVVTTRVWCDKPARQWNWVEGDDPAIHWKGIVEYFSALEHEPIREGEDGFELLTKSPANLATLRSYTQ